MPELISGFLKIPQVKQKGSVAFHQLSILRIGQHRLFQFLKSGRGVSCLHKEIRLFQSRLRRRGGGSQRFTGFVLYSCHVILLLSHGGPDGLQVVLSQIIFRIELEQLFIGVF